LVIGSDVLEGLDITVHASTYGKVPFLPHGMLSLLLLFSTTRPLHSMSVDMDLRAPAVMAVGIDVDIDVDAGAVTAVGMNADVNRARTPLWA
jgi:hypothetical protein